MTVLLFALTELALSLTPGPAVFLVVSQGMKAGFRSSLRGTLGVMTGELIFFVLSALGLGALLIASQTVFTVVKWLGALYLVYLGLELIVGSFKKKATSDIAKPTPAIAFYRQGLVMQLANPKAILFFTAILPQFIDPALPTTVQFAVLGLVSMTVEGIVLVAYGWLAEKGGRWLRESPFGQWLDRLAGSFLIGAGIRLALTGRRD